MVDSTRSIAPAAAQRRTAKAPARTASTTRPIAAKPATRPTASAVSATSAAPQAAGKRVGATVNTMKILAYVAEVGDATAAAIARATGINPSTCFNIARTLEAEGYLQWIADTRRYHAGTALGMLAHQLTTRPRTREHLRPAMQRIANDYALTVTLWRRCSLKSMALEMVAECDSAVRIQMQLGQHLPVLFGGMGRIMALSGGLGDAQRRALFAEIKWSRPLSYSAFMEQARTAKRRGYGVDAGIMHRSVTAIAVPIPNGSDVVDEVLSATMFLDQHTPATLRRLVHELKQLAATAV